MKYLFSIIIVLIFSKFTAIAQIGGQHTYNVLSLPTSPRAASLGGAYFTQYTSDANAGLQNPAAMQKINANKLAINYTNYLADVNYGEIATHKHVDSVGTFGAGFQYINYGKFTETSPNGDELGTFTANEYVLHLRAAAEKGKFSYGTDFKTIISQLYNTNTAALAADGAVMYHNDSNQLAVSLIARNVGFGLNKSENYSDKLPLEIMLGLSQKLSKAPFRYHIMLRQLQKWDLTYLNPNSNTEIDLSTGEVVEENIGFGAKAIRHLTMGVDLVFSKNFFLTGAYNFQRRAELAINERKGTAGISWGVNIVTKRFQFNYANAVYTLAGRTNSFGVVVKI